MLKVSPGYIGHSWCLNDCGSFRRIKATSKKVVKGISRHSCGRLTSESYAE
jgi:hypothetical protein